MGSSNDLKDFSSSLNHVKNAGRIVMNNDAPPPAFFHHPVCYAGRASSVVVSGTPIQRPIGQFYDKSQPLGANGKPPIICSPSRAVDYEMELAAIISKPHPMNKELMVKETDEHIFGFVIVNDWSCETPPTHHNSAASITNRIHSKRYTGPYSRSVADGHYAILANAVLSPS
jgi:2-keto-4-pentenoate hydratase/2-oxohepta-3-ene-1,7-dioic acid hydratase in catechol pathway